MSSEDYSDLTDIESDYEEKHKKKSGRKKREEGDNRGGYKIKNALKVPRATTYTAQSLYDQIHSGDIDLEAEYQRDVVWPETKQVGLIDSIFRNFYIPPVIFAVATSEDGSEKRMCIDGKQRLTSIQRFMDGNIPHKDPLTAEKLWYRDIATGKSTRAKRLLPEKYRRLFANKQIVCVEYHDITDSDEREIFQRVQLGMALTPAEKLQVINTPRASFIRELQTKYLTEGSETGLTSQALEWDRSRGSEFRCLAQALFCIEKFGPTLKTAGSIVKLEKWLCEDINFTNTFRSKVTDTFQIFSDLANDKQLSKVFKNPSKVSPIEFILIPLLITVHKGKMNKAQLAGAIGKMRDTVRDVHVDIRMNDRVARTMLEFIRTADPGTRSGSASSSVTSTTAGEKRKRTEEDNSKTAAKRPAVALPPRPSTPSIPAATTPMPKSTAGTAKHAGPDRMAALRAAKMQVVGGPSSLPSSSSQPPRRQPSNSSSSPLLQTNHASTQLPSPSPDLNALPNGPNRLYPQQRPYSSQQIQNPLEVSLMSRTAQSRSYAPPPRPSPAGSMSIPSYGQVSGSNSVGRQRDSGWDSRQSGR